jgi:hypothetical protein
VGPCPKCGNRIEDIVAEPITIHLGVEEKAGLAYRRPDNKCAAIISVEMLDPD